jgi:hypothetical protein
MLLFEVKNQMLKRLDVVEPATDSQQYLKAKFTVNDADWNGKVKTAYFRLGDVVYKVLLNSNNECIVPSEVLIHSESRYAKTHGSKFFVSLVGEYSTTRITTNELQIDLNSSGYSDALTPEKPTENEYQQILTQYANNEAAINEAKAECETARADLVGVKNIFANAIKGNLSGSVVSADDVSPIEHNPVVKVHGKNLFDYSQMIFENRESVLVDNGNGSVTITTTSGSSAIGTNATLQQLAPALKVGKMYTLSFNSTGTDKYIYLSASQSGWNNHNARVITQTDLESYVYLYASGVGTTATISDMQIEEGAQATQYEPYVDPSTMTVRRCGKNLVKNNMYNMEYGGVTITKNNDQSFYVNGTATQNLYFQIDNELFLRKGRYILSGCGKGGSPDTFVLYLTNDDFYAQDVGNGATFNFDSKSLIPLRLAIYEGAVLNNVLFKPMIRLAEVEDDSFEAYNGADFTPSADGTVEGITSLSPCMTILTDTEGAIVECEYIKDTNKLIKQLEEIIVPSIKISSVTLYADQWKGASSPYSQKVDIVGATINSKINLNPTIEQLNIFYNKDISFVVENDDGNITVYCIGQKPTNDYTMQATVMGVLIDG